MPNDLTNWLNQTNKSSGKMQINDSTTEITILDAARIVFIKKGFDGARMQEIADEAGINKALLHYYFRSKDKLFEAVFIETFVKIVPAMLVTLNSNLPLFQKIEVFTSTYIDALAKNPFIPGFILHELAHNEDRLAKLIRGTGLNPTIFIQQVNYEIAEGRIGEIDPRQLLVNIMALCIFPFVGKPILKSVIFANNEDEFNRFIQQRKTDVPKFIIASIKKFK